MEFEYRGSLEDLYEKSDLFKNYARLHVVFSRIMYGATVVYVPAFLGAIALSVFSMKTAGWLFVVSGILFVFMLLVFLLDWLVIAAVKSMARRSKITSFTFEGNIILGDAEIYVSDHGNVRIYVPNASIVAGGGADSGKFL